MTEATPQIAVSTSRSAEVDDNPLVPIQAGRHDHVPIAYVPGAGDNAIGAVALARALGQAWPVYGLQPRGLDGTAAPHTSVEAAAAAHAKAIASIRPEGPIHLIGHSFGGWIAFELATQMRLQGRPVASLTLLDSDPPGRDDGPLPRPLSATEAILKLAELMALSAGRPLGVHAAALDAHDEAGQRRLLHDAMVRVGLMPNRSDPDALLGPIRTFAATLGTHYRPQRIYAEPVRLALATEGGAAEPSHPRGHNGLWLGWQRWAPAVTVWRVPGNHFSMLKPPHVSILADYWLKSLSDPR